MHTDYKSPVIRWYRDSQQQASRGTRCLTRIEAAEKLIANIDAEASYPAAEVLSQIDGRPLPEAGNRKISGTDLLNDLRLLGGRHLRHGRTRSRRRRRASLHRRRTRQAIQRLDQDDFPLASPGARESPLGVRWSQTGRFPAQQRRSFREEQCRASRTRCTFQPTHRRPARRIHSSEHAKWPKPGKARVKSLANWPSEPDVASKRSEPPCGITTPSNPDDRHFPRR